MQERRHHVQALAAGGLAESAEADRLRRSRISLRGFDHSRNVDIRRRIEIEHQSPRHVGSIRRVVPGMQLDAADLRDGRKGLDRSICR